MSPLRPERKAQIQFLFTGFKSLTSPPVMLLFFLLVYAQSFLLNAAPSSDLDPRWAEFADEKNIELDNQDWQLFLDKYLIFDDKDQSYMAYGKVSAQDKLVLDSYIDYLANLAPKTLTKKQQLPYWINLYNAKTISLILDSYPIESIRKIGNSWFKSGPWDDKVLSISNREVSLNDIEHRILRPIYQQASIHYALNCASYSCPNLNASAYTLENAQILVAENARQYVNHDRGVSFNDEGELVLSSIYKWYKEDFGRTYIDLITHLIGFADKDLGDKLRAYEGSVNYQYDWDLNELN